MMSPHRLRSNLSVLIALTFCALTALSAFNAAHAQRSSRNDNNERAFDKTFQKQLAELASQTQTKGFPKLATRIGNWYIPRHPDRQYLFLPPASAALPQPAASTNSDATASRLIKSWLLIRKQQAEQLSKLADRKLVEGDAETAVQLMYEVLRERPDDKRARRLLGLGKPTGNDTSEKEGPRVSRTAHHAYGWPAGSYWRLQTDHFLITTNHSPAAAEELAIVLEEFQTVWQQLFVSYWTTPVAVRQAMKSRGLPRRGGAKHKVVLFKNQQQYVDHLKRVEPQAAMTLGLYRDKDRTAYFFASDSEPDSTETRKLKGTWRHEAAHQLFYESLRRGRRMASEQNFWLIEGIALYLESLHRIETCGSDLNGAACDAVYYTTGGFDAERLQFARYRALNEQFYVPVGELSRMGRVALQQDSRIRRLYSQSAGLTHFLLDGQAGKHRSATLRLLKSIYEGKDGTTTIAKQLDTTPANLDSAYRRFLIADESFLPALQTNPKLAKLCLGNCKITDSGMEQFKALQRLDWLDLAFCEVSDVGLRNLSPSLPLRQLNLEGTKVTDLGLQHLSQWKGLQELDLSQTNVTDAGMVEVAKLKDLHVLWLTSTKVTDAGLQQLSGLKKLETLDVSHTSVTRDAWQRLKKELPQLNTSAQN